MDSNTINIKVGHFTGKRHSDESKLKMARARKIYVNENNPLWKGELVSYRNLHRWVERKLGKPDICSQCGIQGFGRKMHWANINHSYQRNLTDWLRLCAKCHAKYDYERRVL